MLDRNELGAFYEGLIQNFGGSDPEFHCLPSSVTEFIARNAKSGATSFDVGSGAGHVSRWMFDRGCQVTSIDIVDPSIVFDTDMRESARANLIRMPIEYYRFDEAFDILVCKNVLHFLPSYVVTSLILDWAALGKAGARMYLTCFTDIRRIDSANREITHDNEANFSMDKFLHSSKMALSGWTVECELLDYSEVNAGGQKYFSAKNVIMRCIRD